MLEGEKNKNFLMAVVVLIVIAAGVWFKYGRDSIKLPAGEVQQVEEIVVKDGLVLGNIDEVDAEIKKQLEKKDKRLEIKEIMITDGQKHSIPLDEIHAGGPPKDGIPPIDKPKFISADAASQDMGDEEVGLAVDINGVQRFYPFQIIVFHEIVNDTINGQRILITYCPLCVTGIVFDPMVQGQRVEFGTSGRLWNSNLLMYDRKTDSLWSQVLGEAVVGEMTGTKLQVMPSDVVKFGDWKNAFPGGQVLSRETGTFRVYGNDPYGDYYTTPGVYFPVNNTDDRFHEKDIVLGVEFDGKTKAYLAQSIEQKGEITDRFAGRVLVLRFDRDVGAVRIFEKKSGGILERVNPVYGFWFSWVSVHPETEVYK